MPGSFMNLLMFRNCQSMTIMISLKPRWTLELSRLICQPTSISKYQSSYKIYSLYLIIAYCIMERIHKSVLCVKMSEKNTKNCMKICALIFICDGIKNMYDDSK